MWRVGWTIAGSEQSEREESPDTALRQQRKGNAPGNARGRGWMAERKSCQTTASRKVPQKTNRRERMLCDGPQGNLLIVLQKRFCW